MLFVLEQYIIFEGAHLISDECQRSTINQIINPVLLNDATQGQVLWKEITHFMLKIKISSKKKTALKISEYYVMYRINDSLSLSSLFVFFSFITYLLHRYFYALNRYRYFVLTSCNLTIFLLYLWRIDKIFYSLFNFRGTGCWF